MTRTCCLLIAAALAGCSGPAAVAPARPQAPPYLNMPHDAREPPTELLSRTGAFADTRSLTPAAGLIPYGVNVPFWSDGAAKSRWVAVPAGAKVRFAPAGAWEFPEGTVFVKHFEFGGRRVETRLLVRGAGGVFGAAYRWRDDGSDAELVREGRAGQGGGGRWYFPGPEDCRKCHLASAGGVLGVNTRQLNRVFPPDRGENQLLAWGRLGLFANPPGAGAVPGLPRLARADDEARGLEERARSYLDVNCGYCHRPGGAAADFDARYDTPLERQMMLGAPARINLGIDRARFITPRDPWRSVILIRMATLAQTKMPPLGHEVVDEAGVALLRRWVEGMPGPPVLAPPAIHPKGGDYRGAARVTLTHPDPAAVIRYTTDGGAPDETSPAYAAPLTLTGPTTLRVRAFRPGHVESIAAHETYIVDD